jgi:hypothetical protein
MRVRTLLLFFACATASAQSPSLRRAEGLRMWLDALEHVESTADDEALLRLKSAILEEKFSEWSLLLKLFELGVAAKDRVGIHELYGILLTKNFCTLDSPFCRKLRSLWEGNLDSVAFNESTAALMEKARRMLVTKDCRGALPVLKQVESQEGVYYPQLWAQREAYACLGDLPAAAATDRKIAELRYKIDAP